MKISQAGRKTRKSQAPKTRDETLRAHIVEAAFRAFMEHGYSGTSTLEIATRAKVSKRELYALFESKQAMLAAGIIERTRRMQVPAVSLRGPETFAETLAAWGSATLREITDPHVVAVHRLAINESLRSPEMAATLNERGREANHRAFVGLLDEAKSRHAIGKGDSDEMADRFFQLLLGDTMLRLLLGVIARPSLKEIDRRARDATKALLSLYPIAASD